MIDKTILNIQVNDLHQGFRVYTKDLLDKVSFEKNSNSYLFSFELIAQAVYNNIKISQVPVETNYTGNKRGASLENSIKYFVGTFNTLFSYLLAKTGIRNKIFTNPTKNLKTRIEKLTKNT